MTKDIAQSVNASIDVSEEAAVQFLHQVLSLIDKTNGDSVQVDQFLRINVDTLADKALLTALPIAFETCLSNQLFGSRQKWAWALVVFGLRISEFPLGDRADNLEAAIAAYERALDVYTRNDFPQNWATTQNNLGNAYKNRIRGDRADNLEAAIAAYERALAVRTRNDFPQDWAMTQNNLGNAYQNRICGDRAENLEAAIATYELALQVLTRDDFPQKWASTQNNLGTAYISRIRGDRAENLEAAIAACEMALEVYTHDFPQDWAIIQNNLGTALVKRFQESREVEELDAAITTLQTAQTAAVQGTDSYVFIHYTLGIALDYRYSLHQNPADLEEAITAYTHAAETTPWESDRTEYQQKAGDSQYQLGVALTEAGQWYNGLAQLEASLATYRQGSNRLARADALQQMARTHYLMSNFDKARLYFRDALRIYLAENNTKGKATCRFGLGRLLLRLNFIEDAIAELDRACTLFRELKDEARLAEIEQVYELARKVRERQPL